MQLVQTEEDVHERQFGIVELHKRQVLLIVPLDERKVREEQAVQIKELFIE